MVINKDGSVPPVMAGPWIDFALTIATFRPNSPSQPQVPECSFSYIPPAALTEIMREMEVELSPPLNGIMEETKLAMHIMWRVKRVALQIGRK